MSQQILPLSWQYFGDTAQRGKYMDVNRLQSEADSVRASFPDTAAFSFTDPAKNVLLILRGTLLAGATNRVDAPPVLFAVTLKPAFPMEFPIITIEPPSGVFKIKNHRNVDSEGNCFLQGVTQWNARGSSISACLFELRGVLEQDYPFENPNQPLPRITSGVPVQQQAQRPGAPPGGPTPQQMYQPQHQYTQRPHVGGQSQATPPAPGFQQAPMPQHQQPPQAAAPYHQPPPPQPQPQQPAPYQQGYQPQPNGTYQGQPQQQPQYQQQQQQQPQHQAAPPARSTPPPAGSAESAFSSLINAVFAIGEEELSKSAPGVIPFHTMDQRWKAIDKWCFKVVAMCVSRRAGESQGVELATGSVLPESAVAHNPDLHGLYRLVVQAQVSGRTEDIERASQAFMQVPAFRDRMANSSALLAEMYCPASPVISMEKVWASFFSSAFRVGEEALQRGDLHANDVKGEEPWLYLGLTAATALDTLLRSPKTGPLKLAFGERDVTPESLPPEGQPVLDAFFQLREALTAANLSPADLSILRRKALWADRDDRDLQVPPHIARLSAGLSSIASRASQEAKFKAHFRQTLELLGAIV